MPISAAFLGSGKEVRGKEANPFQWRHFAPAIILLCVRWYLKYQIFLRDVEEMLSERGLGIDYTTFTIKELVRPILIQKDLSAIHATELYGIYIHMVPQETDEAAEAIGKVMLGG